MIIYLKRKRKYLYRSEIICIILDVLPTSRITFNTIAILLPSLFITCVASTPVSTLWHTAVEAIEVVVRTGTPSDSFQAKVWCYIVDEVIPFASCSKAYLRASNQVASFQYNRAKHRPTSKHCLEPCESSKLTTLNFCTRTFLQRQMLFSSFLWKRESPSSIFTSRISTYRYRRANLFHPSQQACLDSYRKT